MSGVHLVLGVAVLVLNALAAGWGGAAYLRRSPSVAFWYLLRSAQVAVVAQVTLGFVLYAGGERAPDSLHLIYGISPLFVTLVSEGMRVGVAQRELEEVDDVDGLERSEQVALARRVVIRETGVMSLGALLIVTLSLRAASSGGLF